MLELLVHIALVLALIPVCLGALNMLLYRPLRTRLEADPPALSVLIPARDEALRITPVLDSVLASEGVEFEVVVADDNSTDATADIVRRFCDLDDRVRLVSTPPLPQGWRGKNHACHFLSGQARHDIAVFLDADVTLAPNALATLASEFARRPGLQLLSGFPRQITGTFWEKLLIPLIHVVLLGYLPFPGVKFTNSPMFATACGQLVAVRLAAYRDVGGHGAIRTSVHDGVMLPRRFRAAGHRTDLADITGLSATRMYDNARGVFAGLMKNAHEGMATPVGLPVWTVLLLGGHVLPLGVLLAVLAAGPATLLTPALVAAALPYLQRGLITMVYRQSWLGAALHPAGVAVLVGLQWVAFWRWRSGRKVRWKGRAYGAD